ncbi:MAG: DUF3467 domain-containing protein [Propionibacteriaceae bacterium]|jgi:hypothetical protein|nr:DUF3467 domain-containing protein [Propionibacteriaceae bacterium]
MADQHIQVRMPVELAAGAFADFIRAWHTDEAFVLDFAAFSEPPRMEDDKVIRDATVVSRVRIPPSQVFELMKALEQQLSAWEKEHPGRKT